MDSPLPRLSPPQPVVPSSALAVQMRGPSTTGHALVGRVLVLSLAEPATPVHSHHPSAAYPQVRALCRTRPTSTNNAGPVRDVLRHLAVCGGGRESPIATSLYRKRAPPGARFRTPLLNEHAMCDAGPHCGRALLSSLRTDRAMTTTNTLDQIDLLDPFTRSRPSPGSSTSAALQRGHCPRVLLPGRRTRAHALGSRICGPRGRSPVRVDRRRDMQRVSGHRQPPSRCFDRKATLGPL